MRLHLLVLACSFVGCADVPGDPDTIVVDGSPLAGYAWSGPGEYCCDYPDGTVNAGWKIWFTNTEYCPTRSDDYIAQIVIVGPERVVPPSTALPSLTSPTLSVSRYFSGAEISETVAYFTGYDVEDDSSLEGVRGTVVVTNYQEKEIAAHFEIQSERYGGSTGNDANVRGTFVAHRCSRLHN